MIFILLLVGLVILIYLKWTKTYNYWIKRGVKQRKQTHILGDTGRVMFQQESFFDFVINAYNAFPEERYTGMYQMGVPTLILRDSELIKQITVKEFDHFTDHRSFMPEDIDPIWTKNLITLKGNNWRNMRATLSPSFTSSKMRFIFDLISNCADEYIEYFKRTDVKTIELQDTFTRFTNDVIASTAFGIKCHSMINKNNEFYLKGKEILSLSLWKNIKLVVYTVAPSLAKMFNLNLFSQSISNFFKDLIATTIKTREEKGIIRPDMIHLLLEARKGKKKFEKTPTIDTGFSTVEEMMKPQQTYQITDIDITAQALIFFFAGFETVSIAMCFMGYELAINPDIQKKLQDEIDETMEACNGKLTYEALMKMKYLDMVVSETLRKWPPAAGTDRVCTGTFTIEPKYPHEKPLTLKPGDIVYIPISGIHRDPQYYPEPEKFNPERFSEGNKENIKPYTYMPFGVGPRNCIGSRFALLEVKTIFFYLLRTFEFIVVEKTEIPLQLSKSSFNLHAKNGIWIGLKPRI